MSSKVLIVDTPAYLFLDQRHLFSKLREHFRSDIYCVVNTENGIYQQVKHKLLPIWERFQVQLVFSKNVDLDVIKQAVGKKTQVAVATNDEEVIKKIINSDKSELQVAFVRIIYRQKNGTWFQPPKIFGKLPKLGYKVLDLKVLNRVEGAVADMLGLDFDTAIKIRDSKSELERTYNLIKARVLPKLKEKASLSDYEKACEEEKLTQHKIPVFYLLALNGELTIKRNPESKQVEITH